jgi:hypothetical protein
LHRQITVKLFIKAKKVMDEKKILFIGLSCVGDVVMTSVVIQTLQQNQIPRAGISVEASV